MEIIKKITIKRKDDQGEINEIYPRTSADMIDYDNTNIYNKINFITDDLKKVRIQIEEEIENK